jgi:hypothetical protein
VRCACCSKSRTAGTFGHDKRERVAVAQTTSTTTRFLALPPTRNTAATSFLDFSLEDFLVPLTHLLDRRRLACDH